MRYIRQIQCCEKVIHSLGSSKGINHSYKNYFYFNDMVLRLSNQNIEHIFNILLILKLSTSFMNLNSTCSKLGIHCKIPLTPSVILGICAAIRNPVDETAMAT